MYRRKLLITLMILLAVFLVVFLAVIIAMNRGSTVFSIPGFPPEVENWIVMILSIIAIIKIVWEIAVIEHK
ncbi:MAG: hypothetical protein ABIE94_06380 [archaeon]